LGVVISAGGVRCWTGDIRVWQCWFLWFSVVAQWIGCQVVP
jgi:hypothetical protein